MRLKQYSYRVFWVIPADVQQSVTAEQTTEQHINRVVRQAQQWLVKAAGLAIRTNPVEVLRSCQPQAWFVQHGNDGKWNTIHNAARLVFENTGTHWGDRRHPYRYIIYVSAEGDGAANGPPNFIGLGQMDVIGASSAEWSERWVGGMVHEIGHTLGLNHEGDDPKDVMRFGYTNIQVAYLSQGNIEKVKNNPNNSKWLLNCQMPVPKRKAKLCSVESSTSLKLDFYNCTQQVRKVYWIDFDGYLVLYATLQPAGKFNIKTFLTHPWLVTDEQDQPLQIHYPRLEVREIAIAD